MGTTTEITIRLGKEPAAALLDKARREFENGARELYAWPRIEASVEIIGRLAPKVERPWPQREPLDSNSSLLPKSKLVAFRLSSAAIEWIVWTRDQQASLVADIDDPGYDRDRGSSEPGGDAQEVYLLHVLTKIVEQAAAVRPVARRHVPELESSRGTE